MSLPFVPGIAERMEELGYDQLLRAYEDKYGKKYPPFRMEVHKEGGLATWKSCAHSSPVKIWMSSLSDTRPQERGRKARGAGCSGGWNWCTGKTGTRPDLRLNGCLSAFK